MTHILLLLVGLMAIFPGGFCFSTCFGRAPLWISGTGFYVLPAIHDWYQKSVLIKASGVKPKRR